MRCFQRRESFSKEEFIIWRRARQLRHLAAWSPVHWRRTGHCLLRHQRTDMGTHRV